MTTNNIKIESTVKDRLIQFIESQKITKTEFCKTINVSTGYISGMRESIQPDKLKSIAINYPSLNIGWLMTGIGDMLNETISNSIPPVQQQESNVTTEMWQTLKEQVKDTQIRDLMFLLNNNMGNNAQREGGAMSADASGFSEK